MNHSLIKTTNHVLILKTNAATFSILGGEECLNKINNIKSMFPKDWNLPNVYLLHGSLSSEEMNKLYNHPKIKSFISLTHGEGFGKTYVRSFNGGTTCNHEWLEWTIGLSQSNRFNVIRW